VSLPVVAVQPRVHVAGPEVREVHFACASAVHATAPVDVQSLTDQRMSRAVCVLVRRDACLLLSSRRRYCMPRTPYVSASRQRVKCEICVTVTVRIFLGHRRRSSSRSMLSTCLCSGRIREHIMFLRQHWHRCFLFLLAVECDIFLVKNISSCFSSPTFRCRAGLEWQSVGNNLRRRYVTAV